VIGGGIIGLSISLTLRKRGAEVLVVERGKPGREASYAAAGMLADTPIELPAVLHELARASARMYPEFVHEIEDETGAMVDLRDQGTIFLSGEASLPLASLEPALMEQPAVFFKERSVDPRALSAAVIKAAKHRGVDIASGTTVTSVINCGAVTDKTTYRAPKIVNCAGAWSGQVGPIPFPTRPVKGQMLALVGPRELLRHVVRWHSGYLVPRSDGRIVVGSTLEEAGFRQASGRFDYSRAASGSFEIRPATGGVPDPGGLGRAASGDSGWVAALGRDIYSWIFCGYRAFSGRDFVGAGFGVVDGFGYFWREAGL